MSSGVPAHSGKEREKSEKPETILGKDNITALVNSTMSYFLSKDFKGLYARGFSKEEIKSAYLDHLLKALNEDYEKATSSHSPPLTIAYVRSMPMAKRIEESIGEYADWLINLNYDRLKKQRRERASVSEEKSARTEQAIGADKFARTIVYLKKRRGKINPKEHRERL